MKNKDTYKNKSQNMFTAYVVRSVKGVRMKYMDKKNYRESMENHLEDDAEYAWKMKNRGDTLTGKNCQMISLLTQSAYFGKKKGSLFISTYFSRNHLIK